MGHAQRRASLGTMRPGCMFCRSSTNKMSREHLFHQAWAEHIPHSPRIERHDYEVSGSDERSFEMPVSLFEQRVSGVCKICNESWMNSMDQAVENIVIELANGRRTDIPADRIGAFSQWATKVALVRTAINRGMSGNAHPALFDAFCESRMPPPWTVINFGLSNQLLKEGGSNGCLPFLAVDRKDHSVSVMTDQLEYELPRLNVVSWGMGLLYVHVVLSSNNVKPHLHRIRSRTAQIAGPTLQRIWPGDRRGVHFTDPVTPDIADKIGELGYLLNGVEMRQPTSRS